jgi:hypothetical protein
VSSAEWGEVKERGKWNIKLAEDCNCFKSRDVKNSSVLSPNS